MKKIAFWSLGAYLILALIVMSYLRMMQYTEYAEWARERAIWVFNLRFNEELAFWIVHGILLAAWFFVALAYNPAEAPPMMQPRSRK